MSQVFVLDANKQALNPIHPGRARLLLKAGKAAVYRRYPFTLILARTVEQPTLHPLRRGPATITSREQRRAGDSPIVLVLYWR